MRTMFTPESPTLCRRASPARISGGGGGVGAACVGGAQDEPTPTATRTFSETELPKPINASPTHQRFREYHMSYQFSSNLPRGVRKLTLSLLICTLPLSPSYLSSLRSPSR